MPDTVPDFLILYATRYALGRRSHSVAEVTDWLEEHWDQISDSLKKTIWNDIRRQEAMSIDGRALGDPCDHGRWERLRDRIEQDLDLNE